MSGSPKDCGQVTGPMSAGGVVVSAEQIRQRLDELAGQIAQHYQGRELTVLAVMTGALIFLADLIRRLPLAMRLCLVSCSSYDGKTTTSQSMKSMDALPDSLAGQDVLVVDDILDTGRTLQALIDRLRPLGARSLKTCVLLKKVRAAAGRPDVDFAGFEIEDRFVVGYGLDYDDLYRNLPDIRVLRPCGGKEGA